MNVSKICFTQQVCDVSCLSAALSMVSGLHMDTVMEEFHAKYRNGELVPQDYLKEVGVKFTEVCQFGRIEFRPGRRYIASVQSLNDFGSMHAVVFECADEDGLFFFFDPNMGIKGKRYYTLHDLDPEEYPLAVKLLGNYIPELYIDVEDAIGVVQDEINTEAAG